MDNEIIEVARECAINRAKDIACLGPATVILSDIADCMIEKLDELHELEKCVSNVNAPANRKAKQVLLKVIEATQNGLQAVYDEIYEEDYEE